MNFSAARLLPTILLVLGVVLHSASAMAEARTIQGNVVYRERVALPPAAVIEVQLVDVSLADAPARTIAETRMTADRQVPIPYELRYDDAEIQPGHSYALQARITVEDRLWFINTTRHSVLAGGKDETDILVERVGAETQAPTVESPVGRWLAEDIRGGGVIDNLQTVLEIGEDGAVTGSGGCNRMTGKATVSGADITFGPIASTRMACPPAVMDQEGKFFAALDEVRSWRIDAQRGKLELLGQDGAVLVTLAGM
ncbi:YbaY family lipoprotein [Aquamicrobium sp. LC103]|uniref:YbaY family lipoprotein n=1 Tax=Aquamicrobium sp. LC103 TaxID=1120658 RepID=UPI00069A2564|nr:YbaY family lipoprotein [Aquamicrobium sp. LC103]TKT80340.1 META domain-containing protein [Aquamicrobium sp. LC103]